MPVMNTCGVCGVDFGSVAAFDAHRVGKHDYTFSEGANQEPPVYDGRRCLGESELAELPIFARNSFGRWSLADSLERARELSRAE